MKTWQGNKSEEVRQMLRANIEPPEWCDGFLDNHRDPDQAGPEIFKYFREGDTTNYRFTRRPYNMVEKLKLLRQYAKKERNV